MALYYIVTANNFETHCPHTTTLWFILIPHIVRPSPRHFGHDHRRKISFGSCVPALLHYEVFARLSQEWLGNWLRCQGPSRACHEYNLWFASGWQRRVQGILPRLQVFPYRVWCIEWSDWQVVFQTGSFLPERCWWGGERVGSNPRQNTRSWSIQAWDFHFRSQTCWEEILWFGGSCSRSHDSDGKRFRSVWMWCEDRMQLVGWFLAATTGQSQSQVWTAKSPQVIII